MEISNITQKDIDDAVIPQWLLDEFPDEKPLHVLRFSKKATEILGCAPFYTVAEEKEIFKKRFDGFKTAGEMKTEEPTKVERQKLALLANSKSFAVESIDGTILIDNVTLAEAYSICKTRKLSAMFSTHITNKFHVDYLGDSSFFVQDENSTYSKIYSLRPEYEKIEGFKYLIAQFEKMAEAYLKEPDNFEHAYFFVSNHPCFWTKRSYPSDQNEDIHFKTYDWETSGYAEKVWCVPDFNSGKTVWMLEAGSHVPGNYTAHYHDFNLDVYAPTVEDGFIELAKRVHRFFNTDGTARKDAKDIPNEVVDTLNERVAEWEESLLSEEANRKKMQEELSNDEDYVNFKNKINDLT